MNHLSARITVHPVWSDGRQPWHSRWHVIVEHPRFQTGHAWVPWRWLAVALAKCEARRRDRQWARHQRDVAREIHHETPGPDVADDETRKP